MIKFPKLPGGRGGDRSALADQKSAVGRPLPVILGQRRPRNPVQSSAPRHRRKHHPAKSLARSPKHTSVIDSKPFKSNLRKNRALGNRFRRSKTEDQSEKEKKKSTKLNLPVREIELAHPVRREQCRASISRRRFSH